MVASSLAGCHLLTFAVDVNKSESIILKYSKVTGP